MAVLNPDLVLCFDEYASQGHALAEALGVPCRSVALHRFPDGESLVRLPESLPPRVVFCRSLHQPNHKLVELMLAARTARELGAERVDLVAPYLCYMRQDKAFHPGEAVSQRIVGAWLAELFDGLVTVDPHLHRVHSLKEAVPLQHAVALHATAPIGEWIGRQFDDPLLVGPDAESEQWVAAIARPQGLDYIVGQKQRLGDREVRIALPPARIGGRPVVLVDDVASTGRTLEVAARSLAAHGPSEMAAVVTHALFVGDALQRLHAAGVRRVVSTDAIPHPTNAIPLAGLLAEGLQHAP